MCGIEFVESKCVQIRDFAEKVVDEIDSALQSLEIKVQNVVMYIWEQIEAIHLDIISGVIDLHDCIVSCIRPALSSITALFILPSLVQISDDELQKFQLKATENIDVLKAAKVQAEEISLTLDDEVTKLSGISLALPQEKNPERKTILYFPGNLDYWQKSLPFLAQLQDMCAADLLCYNYRGIAGSNGFPENQEVLINDGVKQVKELIRKGTPSDRIFLTGRSIGGTLSLMIAAKLVDEGIVVDAGPLMAPRSIMAIIRSSFTVSANFFANFVDRMNWGFDGEAALKKLKGRLIYMNNELDPVVLIQDSVSAAVKVANLSVKESVSIKMDIDDFNREFPDLREDPENNHHVRPFTKLEMKLFTDAIKNLWKTRG